MHRCYLPTAQWEQESHWVEGDEAKHALKVMRMRVGDQCELFDGKGVSALCRIEQVDGSSRMLLHVEQLQAQDAFEALPDITLALAIPKGSNMDLIVQKAVEMGVRRIVPLLTERTIVRLKAKEGASKREKWQRTVLEACKQSGVSLLPVVEEPVNLDAFLGRAQGGIKACCAIVAHAKPMRELLEEQREAGGRELTILIGPEGDFSPKEYALIEAAGYGAMSLGPIILRVETAVFMAIAAARYALG
ncbi:MAG: RsmE family RNA methyltransferase [Akkermansia sp.]